MEFIINGKLYDTEKSEKVAEYSEFGILKNNLGMQLPTTINTVLYKTARGNWYITETNSQGRVDGVIKSESSAKSILEQLSEVAMYKKHFGEIEEA